MSAKTTRKTNIIPHCNLCYSDSDFTKIVEESVTVYSGLFCIQFEIYSVSPLTLSFVKNLVTLLVLFQLLGHSNEQDSSCVWFRKYYLLSRLTPTVSPSVMLPMIPLKSINHSCFIAMIPYVIHKEWGETIRKKIIRNIPKEPLNSQCEPHVIEFSFSSWKNV